MCVNKIYFQIQGKSCKLIRCLTLTGSFLFFIAFLRKGM